MKRLMVISGLALVAACQSAPPAPVAFDAAHQPCEFCRMVGSNGRFAAELVSPGDDPLFFDDIGCLRGFLARGDKVPAEAVAYVVDHRTGAWVRAGDAAYARHEAVGTPMDSHLLAYESSLSRDQDPDARGGTILDAVGAFQGLPIPGVPQ